VKQGDDLNKGVLFAVSAYVFWGLHPIYWKQLQHVPSVEIVSHRILWSLLFFVFIISLRRKWSTLFSKVRQSPNKFILFFPAFLIGSNWGMYIWAVNAGHVIETSLGYFICPLISVFLGVFFLKERLRRLQWAAVTIAGIGVCVMTFIYGQFPWISLYLAVTWGLYGLLRKKSPLSADEGLVLETCLLSLMSIGILIYLGIVQGSSFLKDAPTALMLMGTGVISGLPLMIFIAGARMVKLSLIGILQYIYPTLIFICGAVIYKEPLDEGKIIGFAFIWAALILYSIDGFVKFKRGRSMVSEQI